MYGLSRCRLQTCPPYRGAPAHPTAAFAWPHRSSHSHSPSSEWLAAFVLTMARPEAIDRAASGEVPNQCCERGCRNCPWDYQGGHKNAARRAKKRKSR
eukprot:scaffold55622_cov67-Phaeocystis_antarctica.AAC.2